MGQDLIHAVFSQEQFNSVLASLIEINNNLPFLLNLSDGQRVSIVKLGPAYKPLAELAYGVVRDFPGIFNSLFDKQGYLDDWTLYNFMDELESKVGTLKRALEDTKMAIGSDIMNNTSKVYGSVERSKNEVPGLAEVASKMEEFFEKSPRIAPKVPAQ